MPNFKIYIYKGEKNKAKRAIESHNIDLGLSTWLYMEHNKINF